MRKFFHPTIILLIVVLGGLVWYSLATQKRAGEYRPNIDPYNFVRVINNRFFKLMPGTTFVYQGATKDGIERTVVEVTRDNKKVMGVETVVVHDQVWLNDELIEDTYDWYAQDKDDNVWYFGEETKEFEDGEVVSTEGSWQAGVDGAQPGIIMPGDPQVGQTYQQEYYAGVAEDMGEVVALNESVAITYGNFDGCLKTRDWTPLEEKIDEYKWYCPDVGNLALEVGIYSDERVELVDAITK